MHYPWPSISHIRGCGLKEEYIRLMRLFGQGLGSKNVGGLVRSQSVKDICELTYESGHAV
jgi:hypothetical protein